MDSRARILIVDDHEVLLNALRKGMRPDRNRWDVEFVASAQTALEVLKQRHFDVVVSDLEMPGGPGWGLLASVKEHSPDTARIVMSGLSDKDTLAKVAPYMHRYLPKPCSLRELRESIAQVCSHRPDAADRALGEIIGGADLPSAPKIYLELRVAAASPTSSLGDLAQIICRDPGLAAKVLQLANSAYFGMSGPAIDVETAVSRLGLDMTLTLAVSAHVFSLGSDDLHVPPRYRISALQRAAVASASLASVLGCPRPDTAFAAALLRHVGALALQPEHTDRLIGISSLIEADVSSVADAEREVLSISLAQLGAHILGLWGLPTEIVDAVARYRTLQISSPLDVAGAVQIAAGLVDEQLESRPVLDLVALRSAGLLTSLPGWMSMLEQILVDR